MALETIYEGSSATITMAFTDHNDEAITPDSVTFSLYDSFSGTVRRSGTVDSLASSIDFDILATDTVMLDESNRYELITLSITFTYGALTRTNEYEFKVTNLAKT